MANKPIDPNAAEHTTADDKAVAMRRFERWFERDRQHSQKWREEAKEDYAFVAGEQWDEKDVAVLKEASRPVITFNRIDPVIRSVAGEQINNAQEVRYIPRELGDVKANEYLTSAAEWFRDQCDADDEESDAFWDTAVAGMGWTESRLDDDDPDEPMPIIDRVDPLEMFWDCDARKRNLMDSRRIWRVRTMPLEAARKLFPDAADTDLDAEWARDDGTDTSTKDDRDRAYEVDRDPDGYEDEDRSVTIVHCEWWETEPYYKVALPPALLPVMQGVGPDGTMEMSVEEYSGLKPRLTELAGGMPVKAVRLERKVFQRAFLGRTILKQGPSPCPDHFSFNCITGFRDRNRGTFYGLVRAMKDPQRWANKWLSQTLHIMNTNAKGGVMMEESGLANRREFEESFAKPEAITWVPDGTLANPNGARIQPKPVAQFPQGFYQLMTFAISSVRDVVGVNLEMLGMREADQPASLEYQRRQAGITILAQLFRSMRRYHRNQGKVLLYFIQHRLSPTQLVRIIGENGEKSYQPLAVIQSIKGASPKYDIVVDEGPTSPNQRERVWAMIGDRFWTLPPPIQLALLKYSPFPESVIEEVKAAAEKASQSPQAQMMQQMQQLQAMLTEAKVLLTKAQAGKAEAETVETLAGIGQEQGDGGMAAAQHHEHEMHKLAQKAQADAEKNAAQRAKDASDADLRAMEIMAGAMGKREETAAKQQTEREWMSTEATLTSRKTAVDAGVKLATAKINAANRPKPNPAMAAKRPGQA